MHDSHEAGNSLRVTVVISGSQERTVRRACESVKSQQGDLETEIFSFNTEPEKEWSGTKTGKLVADGPDARSRIIRQASGSYIACIDEKDVWSDPGKLRKQLEFLESHPGYSFACHHWEEYYPGLNVSKFPLASLESASPLLIETTTFFEKNIVHPSTLVFRKRLLDADALGKYRKANVTHLVFELLKQGPGCLLLFTGMVSDISEQALRESRLRYKQHRKDYERVMEIWKAHPGNNVLQKEAERNIREMTRRNLNAPDIRQELSLVQATARYYYYKFML